MRYRDVGWALVGAVIGAGFASGREVMRFFAQYGWASACMGIALACGIIGLLAWRLLRVSARQGAPTFFALCTAVLGPRGGKLAGGLYVAMLAVTGAAMLSGAGELCAIALPVQDAYSIGFLVMLLLALGVARRGLSGLAWVSGCMVPVCCVFYTLLLRTPVQPIIFAQPRVTPPWWQAFPLAVSYGALNIGLAAGLLCEAGPRLRRDDHPRAAVLGALCLWVLLMLANGALIPHRDSLRGAALPMVQLARHWGLLGFWFSVVTMAMAMLTTLVAALRGLYTAFPLRWSRATRWGAACGACALLGGVGFDSLVETGYPVLGWCAAALVMALCFRRRQPECATGDSL